jgi:hypothetical protein
LNFLSGGKYINFATTKIRHNNGGSMIISSNSNQPLYLRPNGDVNSLNEVKINPSSGMTRGGYTVWDSGNHGPGSGLNADTVDNVHASSIAQDYGRLATTTDANAMRSVGVYGGNGANPSSPGGYGSFIVAPNSDTGLQLYGGHSHDFLLFRGWSQSGASFTPWRKVLHDGLFVSSNSANPINPDSTSLNGIYYATGVSLFGQTDGALYNQAYSAAWQGQIFQDFRSGRLAVRGKNSGTWTSWREVPTAIYQTTAPTTLADGLLCFVYE